jgi:hypothetical protein
MMQLIAAAAAAAAAASCLRVIHQCMPAWIPVATISLSASEASAELDAWIYMLSAKNGVSPPLDPISQVTIDHWRLA